MGIKKNYYINYTNACVLTHFSCIFTGGKTPDIGSRMYPEIMRETVLKGEESEVCKYILVIMINKYFRRVLNNDLFFALLCFSYVKKLLRSQKMER